MAKIIRMTPKQARTIYHYVRKHCANCADENCLLLDDGAFVPCPQLYTRYLMCRYFINAVLPADLQLYGDIMGEESKQCAKCGKSFYPKSGNTKYCDKCRPIVRREKDRERKRKKRGSMSAF